MPDIRLAHPHDAAQLHTLNVVLNGANLTTAKNIAHSLANNPHEIVCVAADGDTLAGFCCGQVFMSVCYRTPEAAVKELFVREDYRRRGIARRLLAFMEAEFIKRGVRDCFLVTGDDNFDAQALYESCGWHNDEEIQFHKSLAQ